MFSKLCAEQPSLEDTSSKQVACKNWDCLGGGGFAGDLICASSTGAKYLPIRWLSDFITVILVAVLVVAEAVAELEGEEADAGQGTAAGATALNVFAQPKVVRGEKQEMLNQSALSKVIIFILNPIRSWPVLKC